MTHFLPSGRLIDLGDRRQVEASRWLGSERLMEIPRRSGASLHVCGHLHEGRPTAREGGILLVNSAPAPVELTFRGASWDVKVLDPGLHLRSGP